MYTWSGQVLCFLVRQLTQLKRCANFICQGTSFPNRKHHLNTFWYLQMDSSKSSSGFTNGKISSQCLKCKILEVKHLPMSRYTEQVPGDQATWQRAKYTKGHQRMSSEYRQTKQLLHKVTTKLQTIINDTTIVFKI